MLNRIIAFSINSKLIVSLLTLGLVLYGAYNLTKLPIDAVPDITNNQVLIITSSPSLGAADIERVITFPIELATRNIPGIIEQRSFSRFGLSLVTIVFDDKTDIYWARQQISEKLLQVKAEIPAGMGSPEMGPVTTGLGEIFQYVIKPKAGFENKYTAMELRTIQDWVVRKQLLGTRGIADVSSFGGKLKQYEIGINLSRLKAHSLTITDLMTALYNNNQNTGGAYIEKGPAVLYIRSEGLVKTTEDINGIVVKNLPNGSPILIRDVAEVRLGAAVRYGAMCYNDQGEVAGGVVMMLKGENSSQVIKSVKEKIKEIQKTMPEGTEIEAFLDRTKMVNNAISTVEKNLLEGALIVIFILVLFLGNLRAGILVASVIPLAMLFAIIMMNLFGVSGNLMSLGALDFGLIVDGAVIIVEAVMHKLHENRKVHGVGGLSQDQMNEEVKYSAGKMMSAAVFGQIIILIVYLPILSLEGIEGKMFKPMAQTVAFAIVGAFLLSVTYVPMMASLVLSKRLSAKRNLSDRLMARIENGYGFLLNKVLSMPKIIVSAAIFLFIISAGLLLTLGGEFIPKLEEGDFAIDTRVLTGSSLATTIQSTQQAAHILLTRFPEVEKVVTKIGSGEIPTDPMPMEASDMMVILKPKANWTSARSFDELAEKMNKALEEVPGITVGFQFPVQMRFNELMTGGRQDVVCKIFGDDIDTLSFYAERLGDLISKVDGAKDLYVESVTGLPQIVINYNREALAQYGLTVAAVNDVIRSSFSGSNCGMVYEAERRFEVVIRLSENDRKDIKDIQDLLVTTPKGLQIPLRQVADVQIKVGPNQIQREDARRRISVGFNVRGKDVQTVVQQLQDRIGKETRLPAGYSLTFGGQFENLTAAKKRLGIALPICLFLIFIMLFFAFASVKQGLLIYSAIPLSAIGGVLALWSRGMPFSISAGVGFIALFGVAVLNGIVLISEFNLLKAAGVSDAKERIMKGTRFRLRPVLMTAAVASLGFLPMAISNGAGAEVQRPLATVVIGGLFTATLLTLLVLPVLYLWIEEGKVSGKRPLNRNPSAALIMAIALFSMLSIPERVGAQNTISLKQALDSALKNNLSISAAAYRVGVSKKMEKAAWDIPFTTVNAEYGQINSIYNDTKLTISQTISFPLVYSSQKDLYASQTKTSMLAAQLTSWEIEREVTLVYYDLLVMRQKRRILLDADSLYGILTRIESQRFVAGDANIVDKAGSETVRMQIRLQLEQLEADYRSMQLTLSRLMNSKFIFDPDNVSPRIKPDGIADSALYLNHPLVKWAEQKKQIALNEVKVNRYKLLPQINVGYSNQSINGYMRTNTGDVFFGTANRFNSMLVGLNVPLFFNSGLARIDASKESLKLANAESEDYRSKQRIEYEQLLLRYKNGLSAIDSYEQIALKQASKLQSAANEKFLSGSISYTEWMVLINQSMNVESEYLNQLSRWNRTVTELNSYFIKN
jgi:cobalt-zinc-cadmium resistance protein CzcA